ncbi:MAG: cell division topological specificity factor MinE [Lachnospiraceae bacterium]|nr:cell division topological specificity factor MinE [Lachnospiraceae bacterium]
MKRFRIFRFRTSGGIAKERLKSLLISDRADCSPDMMEMMKKDIAHAILKYMTIDADHVELCIKYSGTEGPEKSRYLSAQIPIRDLKHVSC